MQGVLETRGRIKIQSKKFDDMQMWRDRGESGVWRVFGERVKDKSQKRLRAWSSGLLIKEDALKMEKGEMLFKFKSEVRPGYLALN